MNYDILLWEMFNVFKLGMADSVKYYILYKLLFYRLSLMS